MKKNLVTALVLATFALICGVILSVVNYFTAPIIQEHQAEKIQASIAQVFPEYDSTTETITEFTAQGIKKGYLITSNTDGSKVGVIYIIDETGYASTIEMMIGIDSGYSITGYSVISSNETKGDITTHDFKMSGASTLDPFDALAGSSYSSKAVKKCFKVAFAQAKVDLG